MKIVIDSREQRPLDFSRWDDVTVEMAGLPVGDYTLRGLETKAAIERKSIDDLVGSLSSGRERFEAELMEARGYDLFIIVVEASMDDVAQHRYRSKMLAASVLQSLFTYQARYGAPTLWAGSREGAAYAVKSLLEKFLREHMESLKAVIKAHGGAVA